MTAAARGRPLASTLAVSADYTPENLLDRAVSAETLAVHDRHGKAREQAILRARLGLAGGDVLSVGCGWHPGRHLFPAGPWRLVATDIDPHKPAHAVQEGRADDGFAGAAGALDQLPDGGFDVVLYRLMLHHVVFQGPLEPVFAEGARLLRPGGVLVAVEPNLWHPAGAGIAVANRLGLGITLHGTPDDVPLSPRALLAQARRVGLAPELHTVTYAWRHLPPAAQRAIRRLDRFGSAPGARALGHTVMMLARKPRSR